MKNYFCNSASKSAYNCVFLILSECDKIRKFIALWQQHMNAHIISSPVERILMYECNLNICRARLESLGCSNCCKVAFKIPLIFLPKGIDSKIPLWMAQAHFQGSQVSALHGVRIFQSSSEAPGL